MSVPTSFLRTSLAFADTADLSAFDTSGLQEGAIAFVRASHGVTPPFFMLLPTTTVALSAGVVLAAANGGRWVRLTTVTG